MLIKPIISEKTVAEMALSRYYFRVSTGYTKIEIKKAVEKMFKVNVIAIRTAIMPGKKYRTGKRWIVRYHSDWKKAVVTLKAGQKIDLVDVPGADTK
jgi:large subunit ribosomal protein L23